MINDQPLIRNTQCFLSYPQNKPFPHRRRICTVKTGQRCTRGYKGVYQDKIPSVPGMADRSPQMHPHHRTPCDPGDVL